MSVNQPGQPDAPAPAQTEAAPAGQPQPGQPPLAPSGLLGQPPAKPPADGQPDAAKPDAAKPDAAKPDAAKPDAAKPPAWEPKLPEGVDAKLAGEALELLKAKTAEGKLAPELAQELLERHYAEWQKAETARQAAEVSRARETIDKWERDIRAHPDFGGANLERNVEAAKLVLQKYAAPELRRDFEALGVLSHPEFVYMLMRIGKETAEGGSIGGAGGGGAPERDLARRLFPDFK